MQPVFMFTDPAYRKGLEAFYNQKKESVLGTLRAREATPAFAEALAVQVKNSDGQMVMASANLMTAEMAEKSFVSFDKWLELQQRIYDTLQTAMNKDAARDHVARMEAMNPDSPSHVRATYAVGGTLLAYINENGSVVSSHGARDILKDLLNQADAMGLKGPKRITYLEQEIPRALAKAFAPVDIEIYETGNTPSKRAFAAMWYPHHDVDTAYQAAIREMKDHLATMENWQRQWQANMHEIRNYLLSLQEVA